MRRGPVVVLLGILALGLTLWMFFEPSSKGGASSLSHGSNGLYATRRYLERRGINVTLADLRLGRLTNDETVVISFPAVIPFGGEEMSALRGFVRGGGHLLVAISESIEDYVELDLFQEFGLDRRAARGEPPLWPIQWRQWRMEKWRLHPTKENWPELVMPAPRGLTKAPTGGVVWYSGPSGSPVVFSFAFGRGSVAVVPSYLLSNAGVAQESNADLLEGLMEWGTERWVFDEYRHGLVAAGAEESKASLAAFDLLIAHGLLVYLGAVLALGRRFGQPWRERMLRRGSTATFLRSLGVLHHELGHHREAACALITRAQALDPRFHVDAELLERADTIRPSQLLDLAQEIARRQSQAGRNS